MTPDELKQLQARLGLTSDQLAEALGVSPSTVSKWRTGSHPIPKPSAIAIRALVLIERPAVRGAA